MGKGNRRGGRARAGARHQQHHRRGHFHHRTIGMARGSRTGHFVFGIWLFVFASFLTIAGIALTVVYSTNYNSYYHLIMVAAGVLLLVVAVFMCARAKRKSGTGRATSPTGQDTGATAQTGPQHTATSGTSLQPTETGAPGAMSTSETIPGQPMATSGLSHPRRGEVRLRFKIWRGGFERSCEALLGVGVSSVPRWGKARDEVAEPVVAPTTAIITSSAVVVAVGSVAEGAVAGGLLSTSPGHGAPERDTSPAASPCL
ncbi:Hypp5228 [Branchiostoma lanceolatum]|uniref:Hypp5228 protein n=1 Tax=Branchiostoma lanceolatum TaxID=7740 RepID=A0A8K0F3D3_BRALA|nr:Hypp5228 [Branchiostoma lanceolatum]